MKEESNRSFGESLFFLFFNLSTTPNSYIRLKMYVFNLCFSLVPSIPVKRTDFKRKTTTATSAWDLNI